MPSLHLFTFLMFFKSLFYWTSYSNGMLGMVPLTQTNIACSCEYVGKKAHIRLCNSIILQLKLPELNFVSMFTIIIHSNLVPCQYFVYFMVVLIKLFYQKPICGKSDFFLHVTTYIRNICCGYTYFLAQCH